MTVADDYVPLPGWEGGHWMTLYTWARVRDFPRLPAPLPRYFDVAPEARVLAHCYWQREPRAHGTVIVLHGLEGSSDAHYMRGMADKGFAAGLNVVLLNQRNCGGTEHLSKGLYHSGMSEDPAAVIRELVELDELPAIAVAGYSLGGNVALKLAGEYGANPPPEVKAFGAVSPTIDLARCVEALERRQNAVYEWNFVRNLKGRMRRKARLFPGAFPVERLGRVRTVREFDEAFTAPHHGFRDASDYYHRASAMRVVQHITRPTLIITAANDPFVPSEPFRDPVVTGNPNIAVVVTREGGHCGFASTPDHAFDGYWAERRLTEFIRDRARV